MSREVIHTDGKDVVVREDTAKAFRGINWAIASILAFAAITAVLMVVLFLRGSAGDSQIQSPVDSTNTGPR